MKLRRPSQFKFKLVLGTGALVAFALCIQSVRTYLYTDAVLVPQQAQREAEQQMGALTSAARTAGINDPQALGPLMERVVSAASSHVLWMRVLDAEGHVIAQAGTPYGTAKVPPHRWERLEKHETLAIPASTPAGKVFVTMLPFRMQRPPHMSDTGAQPPDERAVKRDANSPRDTGATGWGGHPPGDRRPPTVIELAIPQQVIADAFAELRQNLILDLIASVALLIALTVIALRAPHYLRGKYLESELQLARRVQSDLQPKPHLFSSPIEFAAAAVAADHVGGDFYDVFEAESGKVVIVLGDVSGKGVPAALLVNVLQGAIRSSTVNQHESACERINRMLCERTAGERFATLFWGVFDPTDGTLRYVNAGHAAPLILRRGGAAAAQVIRLEEGGPVLGLLPGARYSAGTVTIETGGRLILYSDGISEATNRNGEEFGDDRIEQLSLDHADAPPAELCESTMNEVTGFASSEVPPDDRTLLVIKFPPCRDSQRPAARVTVGAVA